MSLSASTADGVRFAGNTQVQCLGAAGTSGHLQHQERSSRAGRSPPHTKIIDLGAVYPRRTCSSLAGLSSLSRELLSLAFRKEPKITVGDGSCAQRSRRGEKWCFKWQSIIMVLG